MRNIISLNKLFLFQIFRENQPLKLHELLEELEHMEDINAQEISVTIFPPENCNGSITDEDSGEEDNVAIDNLPGSQLRVPAEVNFDKTPLAEPEDLTEGSSDEEDNLPLSHFVPLKKSKSFSWNIGEDIPESALIWSPLQTVENKKYPFENFKMFFDDLLITDLCKFTNLYATQNNRPGDISESEMWCFLGVLILSGYNDLPRKHMYWENCSDTKNELVRNAISRDRFRYVMQNFHCCDNNNLNGDDKFAKIRPFINALNKKFLELAPVEEAHSVDESMVPYYGRHGTKQFIRGKPIRWGYKFWTGTTRLGYIEWFDPYQGSSCIIPNKYKNLGLGSSVVLQFADELQKRFPNLPFHLYFDNFFTSLTLLHQLSLRQLKGTGTMRENRITGSVLSPPNEHKKRNRGAYEYMHDPDKHIIVCRWNDNNLVTLASNSTTVHTILQAKRYSQKEKKSVMIEQPTIVKKYNENMGGVDRADQNISLYRVSIRGKKWYFPIICHLLDMTVQNAWQLERRSGGKMDQLSFRRAIAQSILEIHKKPSTYQTGKTAKALHQSSRYDRIDHLVLYNETQIRCKYCTKKVNFICNKCRIGLHPKECFYLYHTTQ